MGDGPWNLQCYDPTSDDGRGGSYTYGTYRTRERAEYIAAQCNAKLLMQANNERRAKHEIDSRQIAEHNALATAGLRTGFRALAPFEPATELRTFTFQGERNGRHGTEMHYYVEALEYDE